MRNRIDYILLGVLWLLAATLATSFWFNTAFGFNIFSAQHWQYLGYMQASNQTVRPMFYISMIVAVFATIGGMYLLLRPRMRRIKLPKIIRKTTPPNDISNNATPATTQYVPPAQHSEPKPQNTDASTIDIMPGVTQNTAPAPQAPAQKSAASEHAVRPPRLNLPAGASTRPAPSAAPQRQSQFVNVSAPDPQKYVEPLREIFESAGYTPKGTPKIGNVHTALLAIGTNEVLWMGAVGVSTTDMRAAIDKLTRVFSDTLEDIIIDVNGFVINAPDAATSEFQDILMFDSIDAVRDYITAHPNAPAAPDDMGNFEAYSAYISTVVDYIGKI